MSHGIKEVCSLVLARSDIEIETVYGKEEGSAPIEQCASYVLSMNLAFDPIVKEECGIDLVEAFPFSAETSLLKYLLSGVAARTGSPAILSREDFLAEMPTGAAAGCLDASDYRLQPSCQPGYRVNQANRFLEDAKVLIQKLKEQRGGQPVAPHVPQVREPEPYKFYGFE